MNLGFALFLALAAVVTGLAAWFGRRFVSMPMLFLVAGILLGADGLNLITVSPEMEVIRLLAEITLALTLFGDASMLPLRLVSDDAQLPGRLLVIALPLTLAAGGIAAKLLFPELPIGYALLVAAVLAPTDASLGLPIYSNPLVPARIRRALNIESGLNDGLASPLVILFLNLTLAEEGVMLQSWLVESARELALAVMVGVAVGILAAGFCELAVQRGWTSHMWTGLSIFALALTCYFLAVGIGGNGFVAAFIGGILFGHITRHRLAEETDYTEAGGVLLSLLVWAIFGLALIAPQTAAQLFEPRVILYAVLSLTVLRMLPVAISMIGSGMRRDTVAIMGWFGPRGLASVVFGLIATGTFEEAGLTAQPLGAVVTMTIFLSVFAHGLSAQPLAAWYARRLQEAEPPLEEMQEMAEMPQRRRLLRPLVLRQDNAS